jgi:uncharacterized protein YdeI (BOF family)
LCHNRTVFGTVLTGSVSKNVEDGVYVFADSSVKLKIPHQSGGGFFVTVVVTQVARQP